MDQEPGHDDDTATYEKKTLLWPLKNIQSSGCASCRHGVYSGVVTLARNFVVEDWTCD